MRSHRYLSTGSNNKSDQTGYRIARRRSSSLWSYNSGSQKGLGLAQKSTEDDVARGKSKTFLYGVQIVGMVVTGAVSGAVFGLRNDLGVGYVVALGLVLFLYYAVIATLMLRYEKPSSLSVLPETMPWRERKMIKTREIQRKCLEWISSTLLEALLVLLVLIRFNFEAIMTSYLDIVEIVTTCVVGASKFSMFMNEYWQQQKTVDNLKPEFLRRSSSVFLRQENNSHRSEMESSLCMLSSKEVSAEEIEQVSAIASLIVNDTKDCVAGICTDLQLLSILRRCDHDEFRTVQQVREWLLLRKEGDADKVREQILVKDLSWEEIPDMKTWMELFPFVGHQVDEEKGLVVMYLDCNNANLDKFFDVFSPHKLLEIGRWISERTILLMEHYQNKCKRVFQVRLLINGAGTMKFTRPELIHLFHLVGHLQFVVPYFPRIFIINASPMVTELLKEIQLAQPKLRDPKYLCMLQTSGDQLRMEMSMDSVPKTLGGLFGQSKDHGFELRSGDKINASWDLFHANIQRKPISDFIGESLEIEFFINCNERDVFGAKMVRCLIEELLSVSTGELPQFCKNHGYFENENEEDLEKIFADIGNKIQGKKLSDYPPEVGGNVNLVRFLRAYTYNNQLVVSAFVNMLIDRYDLDLSRWNRFIKTKDAALSELPGVKVFGEILPRVPFVGRARGTGNLVRIAAMSKTFDIERLKVLMDTNTLDSAYVAVLEEEYFSILLDHWSRKERRIIYVHDILDVSNTKTNVFNFFQDISLGSSQAKQMYHHTQYPIHILGGSVAVNKYLYLQVKYHHQLKDHYFVFERVNTMLDMNCVPKHLGGLWTMEPMENGHQAEVSILGPIPARMSIDDPLSKHLMKSKQSK